VITVDLKNHQFDPLTPSYNLIMGVTLTWVEKLMPCSKNEIFFQ
jgi:hypothetical protein